MTALRAPSSDGAAAVPASRRTVAAWDAAGGIVILLIGSFMHFAYELSGYNVLAAPFAAVNESTWEHLKLFVWIGVVFAVVQHAYLRHRVNNFWQAKALALYVTAAGVTFSFYAYLGIVIPIDGKGTLAGTIATAVIGIVLGQAVSTLVLTARPWPGWTRTVAIVAIVALMASFVVFTFAPPHWFPFENFAFYRYSGEFGILADYEPYRVFR